MTSELSGSLTAFFLFDVGNAIDLQTVRTLVDSTVPVPLTQKVTTPAYIQYSQPPIAFDGRTVGIGDLDGFRLRVKTFDYGVISLAFVRPLPPTWDQLLAAGLRWQENTDLIDAAERCCRAVADRLGRAVQKPRPQPATSTRCSSTSMS